MTFLTRPPFIDQKDGEDKGDITGDYGGFSLAWFEWFRDLSSRMNEKIIAVTTATEGNAPVFDDEGQLVDSGDTPVGSSGLTTALTDYLTAVLIGQRYITENLLPEAGTHEPYEDIIETVTSSTTLSFGLGKNKTIVCNSTSAITLTLPHAFGSQKGFEIKNINTGLVTVDGDGSETIDGATTQVANQWDCLCVKDYGTGTWMVRGGRGVW